MPAHPHHFSPLIPLLSITLYLPNFILQFPGCAVDWPYSSTPSCGWGLREEFSRLSRIYRVRSYGSCNSALYWSARRIFRTAPKFTKIFIYTLSITKDVAVFLLWAITITESRYATVLFESCQNFLLYFHFTFYLSTLQNRFSHSLTTSRVTGPFFGWKHSWKERDPNKLGTRNRCSHSFTTWCPMVTAVGRNRGRINESS